MAGDGAAARVAVVDYGVGNFQSVVKMLRRAEIWSEIVTEPSSLDGASHVILPGVGSFDAAADRLTSSGLGDQVKQLAADGVPTLGICLGMQLLGEGSEEGDREGLGLVPGYCKRLVSDAERPVRIPHMGWKRVAVTAQGADLFGGLPDRSRFYFVHSYHFVCATAEDVAATAVHGSEFTAAVRRGQVSGTQFHPEKSLQWGMQVLVNFVRSMP